ncbi:hypothetical protein FHG87_000424 [Trinorchestia longiramus]|nr:hypothetical protein FHG87_000424 [Trinorchestia longiramus]
MDVGVMQTKNKVFLEQSAYTKSLLSRFGMDKTNSIPTPVDANADLVTTSDEVEECDKDLYQSAVENGCLRSINALPGEGISSSSLRGGMSLLREVCCLALCAPRTKDSQPNTVSSA